MRLTRARYVTICQQFLVTAAVVAVGLSAAGVMTLQIVSPEDRGPDASAMAPAVDTSEAYVASRPVMPKVREIKVAPKIAPKSATKVAPEISAARVDAKADRTAALSAPTAVHGYATVGVTWKPGTKLAEDAIRIQVRTKKNGTWSAWQTAAYHDDHGPDAAEADGDRAERPGTDAVVIGDVDQVQMRAQTKDGHAPADLELAVIDPGASTVTVRPAAIDTADIPASDPAATSAPPISSTAGLEGESGSAATHGDGAAAEPGTSSGIELAAMRTAPKPYIFSRAQWGANESLRDKSSLRYGTIKTGFIHHTVNANSYTQEQVPALIRGIYAYHTQSRGWSDIGYNFLVDRFGRIWEGRYGGVDRPVVGAHTLGYNEYAFAMSAIGNYDIAEPPQAVLDAYARLFAWKLSLYDIKADATHLFVKDRYLNAINGHRDVGQTACPGKYLYAKIPEIRQMAAKIQTGVQLTGDPVKWPLIPTPAGSAKPTQTPLPAVAQPKIAFPLRQSLAADRWPDLLVKSSTGAIKVIPTRGILTYNSAVVSPGDFSKMNLLVAVGDLNGDGRSDVIGRDTSMKSWVFPGDGKGHVSRTGIPLSYTFAGVSSLIAGRDFNLDHKLDVIGKSSKTGSLLLFRGKGGGKFAAPVVIRKDWPFTGTAAVGDFNGDGRPDLMAISGGTTIYLFPGNVGGTSMGRKVQVEQSATSLAALYSWGDLTGDGKGDVMTRSAGTLLSSILAGAGGGKFGQTLASYSGFRSLSKTSLAPMAGSAAADVVGRNADGKIEVVVNSGRANTSAALPSNLKVPTATQVISVGDWDRNGTSDVIVRSAGGDLLVLYPGLGNGKFGRGHALGIGWRSVTRLTAVGDVTGDGRPDLVGRIGTGAWRIFPGYGSKGFKAPQLVGDSLRTFNQIGTGAWSPSSSTLASTDGSFVPLVGSSLDDALRAANGSVDPAYDSYVGLGDVDGDGIADVLAREKGTGIIWLLPGKTTGGFAPRLWVANGFAGYQLIG
ncbi:MAG: FG-GAP-like repeat-containing protein [Marmoricola sp.]